jgi:hypothetical protein
VPRFNVIVTFTCRLLCFLVIDLRGGRRRLAYGVLVDKVDGFVGRDRCVSEFLAVLACSNAVFGPMVGHGKSPCFSRCRLSTSASVDHGGHSLVCVNVTVFWECA